MILVVVLLIAVAIGLAAGGKLEGLANVQLRGGVFAMLLFVAQFVLRQVVPRLAVLSGPALVWLWCLVCVGLLTLCVLNWRVVGIPLVTLGIALNLLVVAVNVGMPVGGSLAARFEMRPSARSIAEYGGFYQEVDAGTVAAALADVVPIPAPRPLRSILSIGDLMMFAGVGTLVEESVRGARYRAKHLASAH